MPLEKQVNYSISQAAVLGLNRAIVFDALTNGDAFHGGGLRALLIAPFFVRTSLIIELVAAGKLDHVKTFATPDDVSAAILHATASDVSGFQGEGGGENGVRVVPGARYQRPRLAVGKDEGRRACPVSVYHSVSLRFAYDIHVSIKSRSFTDAIGEHQTCHQF
ncbi:unnamed protein product [Tilletia caries]|nr:unnamed protein product [Tilletia caries]